MIEQLQGVPIAASVLDTEILPARVRDYSPAMLDTLLGAGEVTWIGVEPLGDRDGRIALYLTDHLGKLLPPKDALCGPASAGPMRVSSGRETPIVAYLHRNGASFFGSAARSGRRRLSAGDRRRDLGAGVEGTADQRHAARAARVLVAAGAHAAARQRHARFGRAA